MKLMNPEFRIGFLLTVSLACVALGHGAYASGPKSPQLLFILADSSLDPSGKLGQCEKLTIEEYRKRGVEVIELAPPAFEQWSAGEGKDYQKAHKHFQHLAMAKAKGADAVGGLTVMSLDADEAKQWGVSPGSYFYGWGISLSGISSNFTIEMSEPGKVRAIPLRFTGPILENGGIGIGQLDASAIRFDDSKAWEIPITVTPASCSLGNSVEEAIRPPPRPMVGLGLDANKINRVVPNSPAAAAGLREGDVLNTFGGKAITQNDDLREAMNGKSVGDNVELNYTRGAEAKSTKVKIADRLDIEQRNSPVGRPLPELIGQDVKGKEVKLSDFRGKVVVLDFWATWCGPCLEDLPLQQLTYERLKDKGVEWVAVSVDDDESTWRDFVKNNKLGGVQIRDPEWAEKLNVGSFPTVFLVDRSGLVACESHGASTPRQATFLAAQ